MCSFNLQQLITSLAVSAACCSISAHAADMYVTPTQSIQAVVNQAQPGDTIHIAPGTYHEVVTINTPQLTLIGQGKTPDDVVIEDDHSAGDSGGTFQSATVFAHANQLTLSNLSMINHFHDEHPDVTDQAQAVALFADGDKQIFSHLHISSYQDTLYAGTPACGKDKFMCPPARQYYDHVRISGAVDIIFGDALAWFEQSEIHGIERAEVTLTAQGRTNLHQPSGYVFHLSTMTADQHVQRISLGRPWGDAATVSYLSCLLDKRVIPAGFTEWEGTQRLNTAQYLEFGSMGAGASPATRISQMLPATEGRIAHISAPELFFNHTWMPHVKKMTQ